MTPSSEDRASGTTEVKVPDIGDFKDVPIIEVLVKEGDTVNAEDPLVYARVRQGHDGGAGAVAGMVEKILVKVGDKVSEGTPILHAQGRRGGAHDASRPRCVSQQEPTPQAPPVAVPQRPPPRRRRRPPAAAPAPRRDRDRRLRQRPRQPRRAPARARARRRSHQGEGHRREGPHHQGRRAGVREGPVAAAPAAGGAAARRHGHPGDPGGRLLQVRPDRDQAAAAHQEAVRPAPAPRLAQRARTSPSTTRPTSPRSRPTARSSTARPRTRATASRCSPS